MNKGNNIVLIFLSILSIYSANADGFLKLEKCDDSDALIFKFKAVDADADPAKLIDYKVELAWANEEGNKTSKTWFTEASARGTFLTIPFKFKFLPKENDLNKVADREFVLIEIFTLEEDNRILMISKLYQHVDGFLVEINK
jgi:hypothetical protein